SYEDDNLDFDISSTASLAENNSWLNLEGDIRVVDLLQLNLSPDSIIISITLDAEIENLDPDLMDGYVLLSETEFIEGPTRYKLDTVQLLASYNDTARSIVFNSDYLDLSLRGKFKFENMPKLVNSFTAHYISG